MNIHELSPVVGSTHVGKRKGRGHATGIGLENVRKRLALIYGDENYSLEIREEEDTYTVNLIIPTLHA